jgi:hypothetical protein
LKHLCLRYQICEYKLGVSVGQVSIIIIKVPNTFNISRTEFSVKDMPLKPALSFAFLASDYPLMFLKLKVLYSICYLFAIFVLTKL